MLFTKSRDMSHLTFQIVFAATRRESFNSDIALDDIRVFNCTDPELQGEASVLLCFNLFNALVYLVNILVSLEDGSMYLIDVSVYLMDVLGIKH